MLQTLNTFSSYLKKKKIRKKAPFSSPKMQPRPDICLEMSVEHSDDRLY